MVVPHSQSERVQIPFVICERKKSAQFQPFAFDMNHYCLVHSKDCVFICGRMKEKMMENVYIS